MYSIFNQIFDLYVMYFGKLCNFTLQNFLQNRMEY